ncbi:MAG: hypothetical protein ACE366_23975 [Bradymonadia bacterium]
MFITPTQLTVLLSLTCFGVLLCIGCCVWMMRHRGAGVVARVMPARHPSSARRQAPGPVSIDPTPGPAWRETMGPESPHPLAWPVVRPS